MGDGSPLDLFFKTLLHPKEVCIIFIINMYKGFVVAWGGLCLYDNVFFFF